MISTSDTYLGAHSTIHCVRILVVCSSNKAKPGVPDTNFKFLVASGSEALDVYDVSIDRSRLKCLLGIFSSYLLYL